VKSKQHLFNVDFIPPLLFIPRLGTDTKQFCKCWICMAVLGFSRKKREKMPCGGGEWASNIHTENSQKEK